MGRIPRPRECVRARRLVALEPDGELSRVELELLDRHLDVCPACEEFSRQISRSTSALRAGVAERFTVEVGAISRGRGAQRPPLRARVRGFVTRPSDFVLGGLAGAAALAATLVVAVGVADVPVQGQATDSGRLVIVDAGDSTREMRADIQTLKTARSVSLEPTVVVTRRPGVQTD